MAYELRWGSDKPGHIVFLIDLSGSMTNKIDYVIDAVHRTCKSISARSMKGIKPSERVSVSIYGYNYHIVNLFKPYTSAQELSDILARVKEARKTDKNAALFDINGEAKPEYQTRMQLAFETATADIEEWIRKQENELGADNVPAPIVINITDGYPYEGDSNKQKDYFSNTLTAAKKLMSIKTNDGNVRVFNIHHDPDSKTATLRFPQSRPVSDEVMQFLFDASSPMSEDMVSIAQNYFNEAGMGSTCMISNEKDVSNIIRFLEWGSSK